jgi:hypothetical protein
VATAAAWPAADSGSAFAGSSSVRRPQAGSITASATKHTRPDMINQPDMAGEAENTESFHRRMQRLHVQ